MGLLLGEVLGCPVEDLTRQFGLRDRVRSYVHRQLVSMVHCSLEVLKEDSVARQIVLFVTHVFFFKILSKQRKNQNISLSINNSVRDRQKNVISRAQYVINVHCLTYTYEYITTVFVINFNVIFVSDFYKINSKHRIHISFTHVTSISKHTHPFRSVRKRILI